MSSLHLNKLFHLQKQKTRVDSDHNLPQRDPFLESRHSCFHQDSSLIIKVPEVHQCKTGRSKQKQRETTVVAKHGWLQWSRAAMFAKMCQSAQLVRVTAASPTRARAQNARTRAREMSALEDRRAHTAES